MAATALQVNTTTPLIIFTPLFLLSLNTRSHPAIRTFHVTVKSKCLFSLHLGITLFTVVFVFISLPDFNSCLAFAMSITTFRGGLGLFGLRLGKRRR